MYYVVLFYLYLKKLYSQVIHIQYVVSNKNGFIFVNYLETKLIERL